MKPMVEELEARCVLDATLGAFDGNEVVMYQVAMDSGFHELHVHDLPINTMRVPVPLPISQNVQLEAVGILCHPFTSIATVSWRDEGHVWMVMFDAGTDTLGDVVSVIDVAAVALPDGLELGFLCGDEYLPGFQSVAYTPMEEWNPDELVASEAVIAYDPLTFVETTMVLSAVSHDAGETWEQVQWQTLNEFYLTYQI